MPPKVVITGLGAVTGFGVGIEPLWEGLLAGRSAIRPITRFDASGFASRVAAEVPPEFHVRDFVPKAYRKAVKVMARDIDLAVAAARLAARDAGLATREAVTDEGAAATTYPADRLGCQIGAGLIACDTPEMAMAMSTARGDDGFSLRKWGESGMNNLTPLWLLKYLPNMLACHVTIIHGAQGPSNTITCSEASGLLSIAESRSVIRRGRADACFSGSAESKLNQMGLLRVEMLGRLAPSGDAQDASGFFRPYAPDAAGGALGEVGGLVILEHAQKAADRGAKPYCEVTGFGGGHSPAGDDPEQRAEGLVAAIENALDDAALTPGAIDAILPHASGAAAVDAEELTALRRVFGARLKDIPLVTITPSIGESMAGAGGGAVCVAAMCVRHQTLPARLHAGGCPPDVQAGPAPSRDARIHHMLVCTNALGGQNAAIILSAAGAH